MMVDKAAVVPRQVKPVLYEQSIMKGIIGRKLPANNPAFKACLPGRRSGAELSKPKQVNHLYIKHIASQLNRPVGSTISSVEE